MTSEDIKHQLIIIIIYIYIYIYRSMGQVLDPSLISLMVSVDVKHHIYLLKYPAGGPRSQEVGSRAEQGLARGGGGGGGTIRVDTLHLSV